MKIPTAAKLVLVAAGVAVAYRLYQLYELGNRLTYQVSGMRFERSGTKLSIIITWDLNNPTNAKVNIKGITGRLWIGDQQISSFTGPGQEIIAGITRYKTTFQLNNLGTIAALINSIVAGKWPVFTVNMRTSLGLFTMNETFDIDSKVYADQIKSSISFA